VDVLFETVDEDGFRKGWTGAYVRVGVEPDRAAENEIASVRIDEVAGDFCRGTIVEREPGSRDAGPAGDIRNCSRSRSVFR
jgi:hypothetical protein